ncbi:hypothetical protein Emag_004630 [Eimeria magna]
MVAILLGTTDRLLLGLSWTWEGSAGGERLSSQVMEHASALQADGTLAAHSVSAAPAVSKMLATSAAIVAAGAGHSGHSGRLPAASEMADSEQPRDGERGGTPYESFRMGTADTQGMHADHKRARVNRNAKGATGGTGDAPARDNGGYPVANKAHRIADANAMNASKVDAGLPSAAQKSRPVPSSRSNLHMGSVAARQQ